MCLDAEVGRLRQLAFDGRGLDRGALPSGRVAAGSGFCAPFRPLRPFRELGGTGAESVRISWESVLEWAPEILILMPCGFNLEKTLAQSSQLFAYPGWSNLPAPGKPVA